MIYVSKYTQIFGKYHSTHRTQLKIIATTAEASKKTFIVAYHARSMENQLRSGSCFFQHSFFFFIYTQHVVLFWLIFYQAWFFEGMTKISENVWTKSDRDFLNFKHCVEKTHLWPLLSKPNGWNGIKVALEINSCWQVRYENIKYTRWNTSHCQTMHWI